MKKFLIVVIALALVLAGCENKSETHKDDGFVVIEKNYVSDTGELYILRDKETGVEYLVWGTLYKGGICPRYDADGTVKVYEGE